MTIVFICWKNPLNHVILIWHYDHLNLVENALAKCIHFY